MQIFKAQSILITFIIRKEIIFSEKTLRAFLIGGSGAVALLFWYLAARGLVETVPLKSPVEASIQQWEIDEIRADRFALRARYAYQFGGQDYRGETLFAPVYLNESSAIAGLRKAAERSWTAWVSASNPGKSSLEKALPIGLLFRASLATLVNIYFVFVYRKKYFKY